MASIVHLRALLLEHPLSRHPFIVRCQKGAATLDEIRVLATQMYKFSQEFGRIMASIFFACPDDATKNGVAQNLAEELGGNELRLTHAELLRQFTQALNISDADLEAAPTRPETTKLIRTYLGLAGQYGYLPALSAVGFASERIVPELYLQLQTGIKGAAKMSDESAFAFFEVPAVPDRGQSARLESLIQSGLDSPLTAQLMIAAISEAMDARARFFDGVAKEARESTLGMLFDTYVQIQDMIRSRDLILSQDLLKPIGFERDSAALRSPMP